MIDSVLESIKKPLGIDAEYDAFDQDIIMHINSVFSTLFSIGASPAEPFMIEDKDDKWTDFLGNVKQAQMVKSYMYIKVKLLFDPPATSFALNAMQEQAKEWEWRLSILEFVFNPESRPVSDDARRELQDLKRRMVVVENQIEEIDDEIDVPNLVTIFNDNKDDE